MKTRTTLAALFVLGLAGAVTATAQTASSPKAAAAIKPGLWETVYSSENTQTATKRTLSGRTCVTAADSANLARLVPAAREPGMQCENRDAKSDGNAISWSFACKSADSTATGKGRLTLFGESYAGAGEAELKKAGAKPSKVMQSYSGKWLQSCG